MERHSRPKRLYITGTASYHEHFTPDHRLPPSQAAGEGCVTVTWLQLTRHLLELTGEVRYADELERTTYNALLAAQSPRTGEVTYFVPLSGRKYYNGHDVKLDPAISCCSSSIPRGIAMIPTFASGVLNGKPALLQYIPAKHAAAASGSGDDRKKVTLDVRGDYPRTGDFEVEVETEQAARFSLVLRAPAWAPAFEATIGGVTHTPSAGRLIEIERVWSPGDKIRVKIPLEIRRVHDRDRATNAVAFVRGPQVLATDTAIEANGGIPESWWGDTLYPRLVKQEGVDKEFRLVTFADAGQDKEEYAVTPRKHRSERPPYDSEPVEDPTASRSPPRICLREFSRRRGAAAARQQTEHLIPWKALRNMDRWIRTLVLLLTALFNVWCCTGTGIPDPAKRPVHRGSTDLNHWVGHLDGHPGTLTPNIDRLAATGVTFSRAYAAAPLCNPSRVSLLTGIMPARSGVYGNFETLREQLPDAVTLPQYFRQSGYSVKGGGKIFHGGPGEEEASWDEYFLTDAKPKWPEGEAAKEKPKKNAQTGKWAPWTVV